MSLDIWAKLPDREEYAFSFNVTHNLTRMWAWAGCYEALYRNTGKLAGELVDPLTKAIEKMKADPASARMFDASNKWGTYDQALPWLQKVLAACKGSPDAVIYVSA